ncbi:L-histidine N(alpha)-methyltransferase [Gilvimarinus sp. F26214L]|uniref:L-histidine N(alpha)-methyltransferase n=1 Tax=Gilvimarinus sp. DZF01 TaxID=3461371 RepID=UPI0040464E65
MTESSMATTFAETGNNPSAAICPPHEAPPAETFLQDVLEGLTRTRKNLHPKYFYDQKGSHYFDLICQLEEYYPFQAELDLLPRVAEDLRPRLREDYHLIEFGAGSLLKVQPLLDTIDRIRSFTPIDISGEHLERSCEQLRGDYPALQVDAVVADFTRPVHLPPSDDTPLGFFPGSTIGNFSPEEARSFLACAGSTLGRSRHLLIGVDTKKSPERLHAAYNDRKGITACFNRNILERINRELGGNFAPERFGHYAFYNPEPGRVEMHLVSREEQTVEVGGLAIHFREGESIHTESSYKYTPEEFARLAAKAGWAVEREWLGADRLFAIYLLRNAG